MADWGCKFLLLVWREVTICLSFLPMYPKLIQSNFIYPIYPACLIYLIWCHTMLFHAILFYPVLSYSVHPSIRLSKSMCHVHVYIYSILYVYVYVYTHPSNAARGPMHHVLFMCFEPKACCFTVQQNPVTLRDSHPLVDDSSGVNWTTKLNWICHWHDKNHQKSSKKKHDFFSKSIPASFRICFRMTTGIHPSMSRTMFRFWMHHIFRHLEAFNHATRRHGSFSFFHVWKKYHGDEFTNRCPFYYFRHNLCYLILLKASSQWGGHPILGFLLDTLW